MEESGKMLKGLVFLAQNFSRIKIICIQCIFGFFANHFFVLRLNFMRIVRFFNAIFMCLCRVPHFLGN